MRVHAAVALVLVAVAGVWSSFALGQVPSVTLPTVTVPSVTVSSVTVPSVTVSSVTVPLPVTEVPIPSLTTITGTTQSAGTAVGDVTGQGGGSAGGANRGGRPRSEASRKNPELHAYPRRFKNRRQPGEPYGTTLSLWIRNGARVDFFIRRESPDCEFVGSFSYRAHGGVNRLRWLGRFRGKPLPPGTYRITAVASRGSNKLSLGSVRVVIAPPNRTAKNVDPQASQCTGSEWESPVGAGSDGSAAAGRSGEDSDGATEAAQEDVAGTTASSEPPTAGVDVAGPVRDGRIVGVLSNPFDDAPSWLQLLLLGALAAAILLLLLAAVPAPVLPPTGAATLLERWRTDLALTGAMILATVAVAAHVL
ncbi:MAG: hypothetical protein M3377_08940 [Actinomycetota bacterium]|nr:hypothetical protein [Actinomycetota bacterium]